MAHWELAAVTRAGIDMLNDLLAGRVLTITNAYGGTESAGSAEDLEAQTDVLGSRRLLHILDVEEAPEGKTVKVQISNSGVEQDFTLHQIGVFARLDDGPERLLCVFQDQRGVEVPSQAGSPSFLLEFYGFIAITGGVKFEVDLSHSGAVVTPQYLDQVMRNHNAGTGSHPEIWAELLRVKVTAEEAADVAPATGSAPPGPETPAQPGQHYFDQEARQEYICIGKTQEDHSIWVLAGAGALAVHNADPAAHQDLRDQSAALDARLSLLELMFNTDVTGNPFTVTFESLTGLVATGVWNQPQRRLEF